MWFVTWLEQLLPRAERIQVPGLGCFWSERIDAFIHPVDGSCSPPRLAIHFTTECSGAQRITELISNETDQPVRNVERWLQEACEELWRSLRNKKEVDLGAVGRLFLDVENHCRLKASPHNLLPDAFGLPDFTIQPIRPKSVLKDVLSSSAKEETPRRIFWIRLTR